MSKLTFLSTDEACQAQLPTPDFYFSAVYGRAVEESDGHPWEIASWNDGAIIFPYLKRSIVDSSSFDVVSPYGYAGTWSSEAVPLSEWQLFRAELKSALVDRGCVAEFQRVGALVHGAEMLAPSDDSLILQEHNHTISIDISVGYTACWDRAESRCRTKTRKARKTGYTWSCRPAQITDAGCDSIFRKLYQTTMERVEASTYYLFSDGYFEKLICGLEGRIYILEVTNSDGDIVVSGLFVDSAPLLHLHLLGSDRNALRDGAGNMAYDGLVQWGCEQDRCSTLHVGGGMAENDSMYKFKKSFGGDSIPFHTASCIMNQGEYQRLCKERAAVLGGTLDSLQQSFFPLYRSQLVNCTIDQA